MKINCKLDYKGILETINDLCSTTQTNYYFLMHPRVPHDFIFPLKLGLRIVNKNNFIQKLAFNNIIFLMYISRLTLYMLLYAYLIND
jgi:hypothetical protein